MWTVKRLCRIDKQRELIDARVTSRERNYKRDDDDEVDDDDTLLHKG